MFQLLLCWVFSVNFNLSLPSAVLKIKAVDPGVVVIQGTEAQKYLAMSDEGRLYGSVSIHNRWVMYVLVIQNI